MGCVVQDIFEVGLAPLSTLRAPFHPAPRQHRTPSCQTDTNIQIPGFCNVSHINSRPAEAHPFGWSDWLRTGIQVRLVLLACPRLVLALRLSRYRWRRYCVWPRHLHTERGAWQMNQDPVNKPCPVIACRSGSVDQGRLSGRRGWLPKPRHQMRGNMGWDHISPIAFSSSPSLSAGHRPSRAVDHVGVPPLVR